MQTWIRANIGKLIERFGDLSLKLISAADYEALENKDPETLYIVTDSEADTVELYLGDKKISDTIISKTITENGTYDASEDDADGYNPVTVDVPIISKNITENGTYDASDDEAAGYNPVTVNIPIVSKTITENGTYNASSDDAAGYDPVTVNVPQPVITTVTTAADLTGYETGDTDLGNGFTITNDSGIVGVGSETIDGVTYSGLEMGGAATFKTMRQLGNVHKAVEFQFIPTSWVSGDMRFISTGGLYYAASVWTSLSNPYLLYVLQGAQMILDNSLVNGGDNNYYDPNLPQSAMIGKLLTVKYTYANDRVTLSVNGVDKAYWTLPTFNSIISSYGLNVGANGAACADMLTVKAEYSSETLSWDGRTWVTV